MSKEREDVEHLLTERGLLAKEIKEIDIILQKLPPSEHQQYAPQITDVIKEYHKITAELITALEAHMKYERENKTPIDFEYRKIHKFLTAPEPAAQPPQGKK